MPDSDPTFNPLSDEKISLSKLSGSMALRVLLVSALFLIVPLFILSALMYRHEYLTKTNSNFFTLKILAEAKSKLIETYSVTDIKLLTFLEDVLVYDGFSNNELPNARVNDLFKKIVVRDDVSRLFYIAKDDNGQYICKASSDSTIIGRNFNHFIQSMGPNEEVTDKKKIYIGDTLSSEGKQMVYVLKPFYSPDKKVKYGDLVIEIADELIGHKIRVGVHFDYPVGATLLNPNGTVLSTDIPVLVGKQFVEKITYSSENQVLVKPVPGVESAYRYTFDGKQYIASYAKLPTQAYTLLLSAPADINFLQLQKYLMRTASMFLIIIIIGGGGTLWFTFRIARPLRDLCLVMKDVAGGDLSAKFIPDKMGFEINTVGEIFNQMLSSLLTQMNAVKNERVEKETLAKELLIGQEVQRAIFPKEFPSIKGLEIGAGYASAKEVGGDFYDVLSDNGKLMFSMADTSGKGVSACFYSMSFRSILRSYGESHVNLSEIIKDTNKLFNLDTGDSGMFVTLWTAIYDPDTKVLQYTNCGHHAGILKRESGEIVYLDTSGVALGVMDVSEVETKEIVLQKGDLLFLYTDGVVEAHNESLEMYGEKRLLDQIVSFTDGDAQKLVDTVMDDLDVFAAGVPQFDDTTILVIKVEQ